LTCDIDAGILSVRVLDTWTDRIPVSISHVKWCYTVINCVKMFVTSSDFSLSECGCTIIQVFQLKCHYTICFTGGTK